ncbi:MAG: VWA domain-containing protein [Blastochloris sp.]|nr:VWA domain-containing protein [Blastochloris sp.]
MKIKLCVAWMVLGLGGFFTSCKNEGSGQASSGLSRLSSEVPRIEVCFVLDTTGSMSGLIEGAKDKIWSIAGEILEAHPGAKVRMGLIGYRDRGDAYVTKRFGLTDDLDALYAELLQYQADGGGDTPESVNQALAEAVDLMDWTGSGKVLRMIFLVGDAPPQMSYQDDIKYPVSCQKAVERGILINTVQCGNLEGTDVVWQKIASLTDGRYVALGQTGDMVVREAPQDKRLEELNRQAGATLLPYGSRRQRAEVLNKQSVSESAPAARIADRLGYNSKSGKAVQGRGDLLDDMKDGVVKLDELKKRIYRRPGGA